MALSKQVGSLSIRVLPDSTKFRSDLAKVIKRMELSMAMNLEVRADTAKAQLTVAKFRESESKQGLNLGIGVSTAIAKAQLAVLRRDRITNLIVKVKESSFAKAEAALLGLSGVRLAKNLLTDVNNALAKIDVNLPKIARMTIGISSLASATLTSSAGLVTLAGDLAKIGNAGLLLPATLGGLITGIGTLALALKDSKQQLIELGPAMTALQDLISARFWAKAKEPIINFVQSVLPQLQAGFALTATALGNQAAAISDAFKTTLADGVLLAMFDKLGETMDIITGGATNFAESLTTLGTVGSQYLPRFAQWVVKIGDSFNSWLQDAAVTGRLDAFIEDGITQMKYFGSAVDGFIGVLRGIDSAATAAGGTGLQSFAENMQGAAAAIQSPAFQAALTSILTGAGAGMKGIGEGFYSFGGALGALAPQISTILTIAGESIGGFITAMSEAVEQPAFKIGLVNFFEGIGAGIDALGPAMGPLFAFLGQLGTTIGVMAAEFGPLLAIIKETFAPVLDSLLAAITPLIPALSGAFQTAIAGLAGPMTDLGNAIGNNPEVVQALAAGILAVVAAVKLVSFGALIIGLGQAAAAWVVNTAAVIASKIETMRIMAMYAADGIRALGKFIIQIALSTGAWIANTAAVIANKVQTLILMGMYMADGLRAVGAMMARVLTATGIWIANTAAVVAARVATVLGTVAQYAMNLAMSLNPIGIVIAAIVALVAGLVWFFTQTEMGQEIWANFTTFLSEAWTNIVAFATTTFTVLGEFFSNLWAGIVGMFNDAVAFLLDLFFNFNPIGIIIANWDAIVQFFVDTWTNITTFIGEAIENVRVTIETVIAAIVLAWNLYWDFIFTTISDVWTSIVTWVGEAIENVRATIEAVVAFIAAAWKAYWDGIFTTVSDIWNNMIGFIEFAIALVRGKIAYGIAFIRAIWDEFWERLGTIVSDAWARIQKFVTDLVEGIKTKISDIGTTLKSIPGTIKDAFVNAGTWLLDSGKAIVQGLIDGIKNMIGGAKDAAKGVMTAISDFFPHSPAKEGPFSGKGWTLYSGQAVGEGLAEGMDARVSRVRKSALAMVSAASGTASIDLDSATTAGQVALSRSGDQITVQGDVGYDPEAIAEEINKKKRQASMLAGIRTVAVR